jgi:hypothetical protein
MQGDSLSSGICCTAAADRSSSPGLLQAGRGALRPAHTSGAVQAPASGARNQTKPRIADPAEASSPSPLLQPCPSENRCFLLNVAANSPRPRAACMAPLPGDPAATTPNRLRASSIPGLPERAPWAAAHRSAVAPGPVVAAGVSGTNSLLPDLLRDCQAALSWIPIRPPPAATHRIRWAGTLPSPYGGGSGRPAAPSRPERPWKRCASTAARSRRPAPWPAGGSCGTVQGLQGL